MKSERYLREKDANQEYYEQHRPEILAYQRDYHARNRERENEASREYYLKHRKQLIAKSSRILKEVRTQVFEAYGDCCSCCGETNKKFLTLHHINGDGKKAREKGNIRALRLAIAAKDHAAYTILCFNCHHGMHGNNGVCPHKEG